MAHKNKIIAAGFIITIIICFVTCTNYQSASNDPRGNSYAGSATCLSCHKDVADSYLHNEHFKSSAKVDYNQLQNFINDSNKTVQFVNDQEVILSYQDLSVYQSYLRAEHALRKEKIDIAFGAGEKAQTYAYWKDSQLFQLPLTYLSKENLWTNSPGFPVEQPYFTRPIVSRCLECHTSYAQIEEKRVANLLQTKQVINPDKIVFGIDCERCHGPAAQHANYQLENPTVKETKYITSIKSLSRQQQLDLCGTCHSGDPVSINSIFNFIPGDTLAHYYLPYSGGTTEPDVHGMQSQLLQLSKCFKQSQLTCVTCHSPHNQETEIKTFIDQCSSCHKEVKHNINIQITTNNCITCHMPQRSSKSLDFNNQKESHNIQYLLRTHRIAVYAESEWK